MQLDNVVRHRILVVIILKNKILLGRDQNRPLIHRHYRCPDLMHLAL